MTRARLTRRRLGPWGRAAALLALGCQLVLGALPHSDRLPNGRAYLSNEGGAASLTHAATCEACVLGHCPAAPANLAETTAPLVSVALATPTPLVTFRTATPALTRSRAPPVLSS